MYCNLSEQEARSTLTTLNRSFHILTEINFFFKNAFLLTFFGFLLGLQVKMKAAENSKNFFFHQKNFFFEKKIFFRG